jgi:hypothetical protein
MSRVGGASEVDSTATARLITTVYRLIKCDDFVCVALPYKISNYNLSESAVWLKVPAKVRSGMKLRRWLACAKERPVKL